MGLIFNALMNKVPNTDQVIFSAHNHNDPGLAVANTLVAIQAGARQIECTISGIESKRILRISKLLVKRERTEPPPVAAE